VVVDGIGFVTARQGDTVRMVGGYAADDTFTQCGQSEVVPS
jgi:hypothetical protein